MQRRDFFKTSAAMVAAAAFPGCGVPDGGVFSDDLILDWRPYTGQLKYTFTIATYSRTFTPLVLVRLRWRDFTGYGEASMPQYLGETTDSVTAFLARVAGEVLPRFKDPFLLDDILAEVDALAQRNTAAKAAVDIALHDLVGRIVGRPWWQIWGYNASKTPCTSYTIGYDESDDVVNEKIEEAAWTKVIKVKLGMGEKQDKRMIDLIRARLDTVICVDANQGWKSREMALDMIHWLAERNVCLIEQPMAKENLDDAAWLTERSPLPVIADEACQRLADIPRLAGAYNGINIKLMKCTGMREAHRMAELAHALGMEVMLGCMTETSVAVSAAAQLSPVARWADLDGNILLSNDCFSGMRLLDGKITLNDKPGIGVEPLKPFEEL
ncbi:MAG: dipeptide epimerase [Bacteroidales bacterium]|nr:dipeptide epimerase [Bacteroidales bacterium]